MRVEDRNGKPGDLEMAAMKTAHPLPPAEGPRKWVPYEVAWTETPFLFFLARVLPHWYRLRNALLRNPFCSTRFPQHLPGGSSGKGPALAKSWYRSLTLGELLVMLPILGGTIAFSAVALVDAWGIKMTGKWIGVPVVAVLAFASRNSVLTFLLGVPFERALFWHKMIGTLVVVTLTWIHAARAFLHEKDRKAEGKSAFPGHHDDEIISGLVLGCIFTAFPILSPWFLRRRLFNVFYTIHILLVVAAAVFSGLHEFPYFFIGLGIWGVDISIRFFYLVLLTAPKKCTATRLPANVIRLSWTRPKDSLFKYGPGQYVFIMVPGVNIFEWHPFSLSSSPHQDTVSVHIRVLGNWTKNLYDLIGSKGGGPIEIPSYWEGPYGAPEIDVEGSKYQLFLLISGGIGITPLQSLANSLAYQHEEEGRPMKKVWFVWSCADKFMVSANFEHDDAWRGTDAPPRLPLSFQPDTISHRIHTDQALLQRVVGPPVSKPGELVHTEFYLTRVRSSSELEGANIKPELQPFVKYGRPNLPEIFATFRAYAQSVSESRVGVLTCGPGPLVDDVRRLCGTESKNGVAFDYHAEIFEF